LSSVCCDGQGVRMSEATPIVWENLLREKVTAVSGKGRYTCIDSSPNGRLALGTASGSLYIYELTKRPSRTDSTVSARLLEVVPLPDVNARVSQVRISPADTHVAVAAAGQVFILTMKFPAKFVPPPSFFVLMMLHIVTVMCLSGV